MHFEGIRHTATGKHTNSVIKASSCPQNKCWDEVQQRLISYQNEAMPQGPLHSMGIAWYNQPKN